MKIPGPDHPISVTPAPRRVRVRFQGHTIVDSDDALILKEAGYKPVYYFPRADVSMEYLARTERSTHCPYKGDASYFTLAMDGRIEENAVWSYEHPFEHMGLIEGRLAFYPDRIDEIHEVDDKGRRIDPNEVVKHTDAGDGHSQGDHWAPNVTPPSAV